MDGQVLLLWDIDHTLIENGGVSKENYALAFRLLTGRAPVAQPQTDGRTDVGIMEDILRANGENPQEYASPRQWDALVEAAAANAAELSRRGHAMPGAAQLLAHLSAETDVIQGVLTGNIEPNARIKLGAFGLDRWIDFDSGGFGWESATRSHLVPVAQTRAASRHAFNPESDCTVLVGDTVRDVQAGLDGGARVIAVATGVSSQESLWNAGAHVVLPDLASLEAFLEALALVRNRP